MSMPNEFGVNVNPVRDTITINRSVSVLSKGDAVNLAAHLLAAAGKEHRKEFDAAMKVLLADQATKPRA